MDITKTDGRVLKDFLILHVTRRCNQNCVFCCYPSIDIDISPSKAKSIIKEYGSKVGEIVFSGGEATLVPELTDYIKFANSFSLRTRLISNGSKLADFDYCQKLIEAKIDHITISLQSHLPEIQDALTNTSGSFKCVMSAIKNLISLGSVPSIMVTINKSNYRNLLAMSKFLHNNFPMINTVIFILLDYVGRVKQNSYLHVSLSEMETYFIPALDFLSSKDYKLDVDGVPFCYLGHHFDKSTEYNQTKNDASYFVYDLETNSVIGGPFKDKIKELYTKSEICDLCKRNSRCAGVSKTYSNYRGVGELYPIF